jgi:Ca2+-binding EF-hand superfamily protein
MRVNPVLAALDSDHDGEISASEISNSCSTLKKLDRNGDGSLTPDEVLPDQAVTQAAMIMARLDSNGDGLISRSEQEAKEAQALRKLFQNADRNHDGLITEDEVRMELRLRVERKNEFDRARRAAGFR